MKWIKLILFKVILPVFFTIIIIGMFYSLMTMSPFPKSLGNSPLIFCISPLFLRLVVVFLCMQ